MKIISISSHYRAKENNLEAKEYLEEVLYTKSNPLFHRFNKDHFMLDDTNGFISIVKTNSMNKDITEKQLEKFIEFLKKHIGTEGEEIFLFFGNTIKRYSN